MACCQVGDGAPRVNKRSSRARRQSDLSGTTWRAAVRAGGGYVQMVESSGANAAVYMLAKRTGRAWRLWCARCSRVPGIGRSGRRTGVSRERPVAGHQQFQNSAALAGNPVRAVSESSSKWGLLNYEAGRRCAPAAKRRSRDYRALEPTMQASPRRAAGPPRSRSPICNKDDSAPRPHRLPARAALF